MQEMTVCGYRCDLCKAYAPNVERKDERAMLSKVWSKYYNLDIKSGEIKCDGCRYSREDTVRIDNNCPVRNCVTHMNIEHCGNCNSFPCSTFNERKGPSIEEAQSKLGSQFDYEEYQEYLLAYDNFTRLIEHIKNK
jgi:hypothetical protein